MSAALAMPGPQQPGFQAFLGDLAAQYLAASNLLGRLHVLLEVTRKTGREVRLNTVNATPARFAEGGAFGFESLPFTKAIERLRNLSPMTRLAFDGLRAQYRMQAFTVSGIADVALIEKIQQSLLDVLGRGGTQADFRNAVDRLTSEAGVSGIEDAQLHTIFMTNFQSAYSNGRFEQMRDPAVTTALPFWKYWTVGDARVRPAHAALDGFVARHDDPVWRKIYPPSGYNCRCSVTAVGPEDAPADAAVPGTGRLPGIVQANVPEPGWGARAWG